MPTVSISCWPHWRSASSTNLTKRRRLADAGMSRWTTLVDAGHTELAYDVLLSTDIPSWLYPISKGATTVWETWDAIKPDGSVSDVSQNHYDPDLHRYVAGLDTTTATTRPYRTPTGPCRGRAPSTGPCRPAGPSATGSSLSTPPSRWGPPQRSPSAPHRPTSAPEPTRCRDRFTGDRPPPRRWAASNGYQGPCLIP